MDYIWVDKNKVLKISKKYNKKGYVTAGEVIPAGAISNERIEILIERKSVVKTFDNDNELKKENDKLKKELKSVGNDKEVEKLKAEIEKLKAENEELNKILEESTSNE
jgi:seryl-tRNA synthetase